MCGFLGFIGKHEEKTRKRFLSAFEIIDHRGPDNSNTFESDKYLLGHKRLAIIDLDDRSNQPFTKENNFLLYNGEIYNYKSLRNKLKENFGCVFETEGDTEVLFFGLMHKGIEFLQEIDGMFSLCFISNNGQVLLARDRFGQKPLFYGFKNDESLVFGSELQAIIKLVGNEALEVNEEAFSEYFQYGASIAPKTMFKSLKQVVAGEAVTISLEKKSNYSECWDKTQLFPEIKTALKDALTDRLKSCFVADTDVAILSSGGIDSSALIKTMPYVFRTTSAVAVHLKTKEDEKGLGIAKELEAANLPLLVFDSKSIFNADSSQYISMLLNRFGEPFADTSYFYSEELYSTIPDKYKVVIGGDGADEMFMGYRPRPYFYLASLVTKIIPVCIRRKLIDVVLDYGRLGLLFAVLLGCKDSSEKVLMGFSTKDLKEINLNSISDVKIERRLLISGNEITDFYANYLMTRLKNVFMKKSDHASMRFSKELRSPYLQGNKTVFPAMGNVFSNIVPKLKLKLYMLNSIGLLKIFRKKVGFEVISENNEKNRQSTIIDWCKKNKSLIDTYFIYDRFMSLIKNTSKDRYLFRIEVFIKWLEWAHSNYERK
ncbi:MAG: hypothetical protein CMF45_08350 [Legionellales bacterium]|nr:hypothetical protein [Legionellales bacterium]|tara:strand:+ start:5952 stop:7751 length:1800 start_codon:yes stop_codon:yes gene_type:complete